MLLNKQGFNILVNDVAGSIYEALSLDRAPRS